MFLLIYKTGSHVIHPGQDGYIGEDGPECWIAVVYSFTQFWKFCWNKQLETIKVKIQGKK